MGGISQARKISALAESFQVPVVAGQMHNYNLVMASLNSPIAEFFPKVDVEVEVGNELFWFIFDGEPVPVDGHIDLDENTPGLGLTVNEESLQRFKVTE